ncbi:hypothetical protein GTY53_24595 [Streptomyces sp. SID7805]|nr:hypothetical protein [Streptomyces sp. SID7805]
MTAPPQEATAHLEERFGTPLTTDLISDRRGSLAWKVTTPSICMALKTNAPDSGTAQDKAAEIAREDAVLTCLTEQGAIAPSYRVDAGPWDNGWWLTVQWVDGKPLWRALTQARQHDTPHARRLLLNVARTWAQRLVPLHQAGWAHADVQPTNTLIAEDRTHLIDFALACGPDQEAARPPYRGALTHTTAPEVADALLSTPDDTHVQAQPPADIWGLAASLFWCWTGRRPVAYEDESDRTSKLQAIAKGRTLPLTALRPWLFPALEELINASMAPEPQARPSAAELVAALTPAGIAR